MTAPPIDYWTCQSGPQAGNAHHWIYQGRVSQRYHCGRCSVRVQKADLKEHTDA